MPTKRKTILEKLKEKYDLDMQIEIIKIDKKDYFIFTGYTLGNKNDFQITTECGKMLLFKNVKEICKYFGSKNKKELYYSKNTYLFLKALKNNFRYVQSYLRRSLSIDFDFLKKVLKTKRMGNKYIAFHNMFEVLVLFRSLFRQQDSNKLNSRFCSKFIDVIFEPDNKKYIEIFNKILKDKTFIDIINNFNKYSLIYRN